MKKKRILAWICILFLVGMYVTDFVLALIGSDLARNMLMASCICTILIPIVLYGVVTAFGGRGRGPESRTTTRTRIPPSPDLGQASCGCPRSTTLGQPFWGCPRSFTLGQPFWGYPLHATLIQAFWGCPRSFTLGQPFWGYLLHATLRQAFYGCPPLLRDAQIPEFGVQKTSIQRTHRFLDVFLYFRHRN